MNSNTSQNGGPPHTKPQSAPSNDLARPSIEQQRICKEFVLGICNKGARCKLRHELEFETVKNILKFCHYYQNNRCTRSDCPYLHASSEEERLFLSTGRIPNVLAERYAAMSYPPIAPGAEAGAHAAPSMYMNEYQAQPPLPPPPPTTMPAVPPPPPTSYQPSVHNPQPVQPTPMASTSSARYSAPAYNGSTGSHNTNIMPSNIVQQPVLPFYFDPSRPPPPLPVQQQNNLKRSAEAYEAGPSKMRKPDYCGNCQLQTPRECEPLRAVLKRLLSPAFMAAVDLIIMRASPEERGHYYDLVKQLFRDRLIISLRGSPLEPVFWDDALLDVLDEQVKRKRQFNVCCCGSHENNHSRYEPDAGAVSPVNPNANQYSPAAAIAQAVVQLYANAIPGPSSAPPVANQVSATPVYQNYQEVQPVQQVQRPYYAYPSSSTYAPNAGPSNAPVRMAPPYQYGGARPPAPSAASTSTANSSAQQNAYTYNSYPYQNHHPDPSYQ